MRTAAEVLFFLAAVLAFGASIPLSTALIIWLCTTHLSLVAMGELLGGAAMASLLVALLLDLLGRGRH